MSDPHVLGDELAPTPFTAGEIAAACPDGHWLLVRTERVGETSFQRSGFEQGDAEGVHLTNVTTDASGTPTGEVRRSRATWRELQAHAAFPRAATSVAQERIRLAFGERDCLRYDVAGAAGSSTFWFAIEHPGMPVRYRTAGVAVEVVAIGGAALRRYAERSCGDGTRRLRERRARATPACDRADRDRSAGRAGARER
ncbi:hypothetical protein [Agrococcus sp. ARC_14]|uniref:hypothetical protein n=1 Tax=Agrococcus sp. ARC_14 TaxID=2919927 RepID=UPI001F06C293|nr:hypothetical protein [Agrococcus sp. ARC_14]MCH1881694.1 hypothetical protein [Agrococcus sp. ARC_14]